MTGMIFESSRTEQTLFETLIDAVEVHGRRHPVLEDVERRPIGYGRLLTASFALGRPIARETMPGEVVGLLLPNSVGAAVTFFALQSRGRVPAMLNFSAGSRSVVSACRAANVRRVYTSRRFLELGRLEDVGAAIEAAGIRLAYLEDMRAGLSLVDRLLGLAAARVPGLAYRLTHRGRDAAAPAAVLFTSGSEGTPKGVVLSHANLQANRHQVSARIDFGPTDVVFNALPVFHSFGLTCGTLLPLLAGVKVFLYPSPLHYRIVPELAYDTNATIMFGTDTFLSGYARFAHPYDFYSMRYVFAGAERLRDETRRIWSERFGVRILEGYGATETSPVLSINTPMENRTGTVGRLVPGIRHRLEPVPGIEGAGRLMVAGPNVMSGYLRAQHPGVLEPPAGGWYDTGDVVSIDPEGYVTIRGRLKRFAKVGGEMVSLGAVEEHVGRLWPGQGHAAVALEDPRRGEQVVLVTERGEAQRDELAAFWQREGIAEISMPRAIVAVDALPLLGSGKVDYVAVAARWRGEGRRWGGWKTTKKLQPMQSLNRRMGEARRAHRIDGHGLRPLPILRLSMRHQGASPYGVAPGAMENDSGRWPRGLPLDPEVGPVGGVAGKSTPGQLGLAPFGIGARGVRRRAQAQVVLADRVHGERPVREGGAANQQCGAEHGEVLSHDRSSSRFSDAASGPRGRATPPFPPASRARGRTARPACRRRPTRAAGGSRGGRGRGSGKTMRSAPRLRPTRSVGRNLSRVTTSCALRALEPHLSRRSAPGFCERSRSGGPTSSGLADSADQVRSVRWRRGCARGI